LSLLETTNRETLMLDLPTGEDGAGLGSAGGAHPFASSRDFVGRVGTHPRVSGVR
jgi:hypothetical protein